MSEKHRWHDPANDGQVDYEKVGARFFALIMILILASAVKIAIANHWLDSFNELMRLLGY